MVFFVRHNGGSVWFDELGPPWPKHVCFDDGYDGERIRKSLRDESQTSPNLKFGVVIETEVVEPGISGRTVVRCSDGMILDFTINTDINLVHFVGVVVLIEHEEDGSISLRLLSNPSRYRWSSRPYLAEGARITFERRDYIWDGRQWYRANEYTIAPTGLQQRLTAYVDKLLNSLDEEVQ